MAKWSQLEALNRLEKYLAIFNIIPEWSRDIDMSDPKILAFLKEGYVDPLFLKLKADPHAPTYYRQIPYTGNDSYCSLLHSAKLSP